MGLLLAATVSAAQTPQPFPQPRGSQPPPPAVPDTPPPAQPPVVEPAPRVDQAAQQAAAQTPAAAPQAGPDLGGIPLYPNAVYLTSYDAGRGQKFHLYGVQLSYADAVTFYQSALKQRGERLFDSPPTHQFEVARFRDSEMAFPPSVTLKDYTWGGGTGYSNPTPGAQPERFPTIIQVVPLPYAR